MAVLKPCAVMSGPPGTSRPPGTRSLSIGATDAARIDREDLGASGYVDYYAVDGRDRLWWVNRRNGEPTSGQAAPYTVFNYDADGRVSYRERRYDGGGLRKLALVWDSDDRRTPANRGVDNGL